MYKCPKHQSNEGYYDEKGRWRCWYCEKEDKYKYPEGKLFDKATVKGYELRILVLEGKPLVEVWDIKNAEPRLKRKEHFKYMSQAVRYFNDLIEEIKEYGKL